MIKTSLLLLLIAHLFGDFYFQPKSMVKNKCDGRILAHVLHSLIYFAFTAVLTIFFFDKWWVALIVCFAVGVLHLLTDYLKSFLQGKFERNVLKILIFLFDQIIHIVTLVVASLFLVEFSFLGNSFFIDFYNSIGFGFTYNVGLLYIFSILLMFQPANIINRYVLDTFFKQKEEKDNYNDNDANAGVIIGCLERITMYCFSAFLCWLEIIPIVLTVKTFVRFKRFNTKQGDCFAEKYIVGTLLSTLFVGLCLFLKLGVA